MINKERVVQTFLDYVADYLEEHPAELLDTESEC